MKLGSTRNLIDFLKGQAEYDFRHNTNTDEAKKCLDILSDKDYECFAEVETDDFWDVFNFDVISLKEHYLMSYVEDLKSAESIPSDVFENKAMETLFKDVMGIHMHEDFYIRNTVKGTWTDFDRYVFFTQASQYDKYNLEKIDKFLDTYKNNRYEIIKTAVSKHLYNLGFNKDTSPNPYDLTTELFENLLYDVDELSDLMAREYVTVNYNKFLEFLNTHLEADIDLDEDKDL